MHFSSYSHQENSMRMNELDADSPAVVEWFNLNEEGDRIGFPTGKLAWDGLKI
jgi:hypothetical protein